MDAASILLILAVAGQTAWTPPDRYAPPPAVGATADRYALPQSAPAKVSPASPRLAADPQWQQKSDQSPFSVLSPSAENRSRGAVAPPPWETAASALEESWASEPSPIASTVDYTYSPGMIPKRTDSGWTSIGIDVAAPPLIVPPLLANSARPTASAAPSAASNASQPNAAVGPTFPAYPLTPREGSPRTANSSSRQPPPANRDAHAWADSWGNYQPQTATNSAAGNIAPLESTLRASEMVPVQPVQPSPQIAPQSSPTTQPALQIPTVTENWSDLWKDDSRLGQSSQAATPPPLAATTASTVPAQPAETATNLRDWGEQPIQQQKQPEPSGPTSNVVTIRRNDAQEAPLPGSTAAPLAATITAGQTSLPETAQQAHSFAPPTSPTQFVNSPVSGSGSSAPASSADQTPWLPLLIVSLSLAGSLGANVFLGWSYLDARQKYRSLVRKTAEKFRRATSVA